MDANRIREILQRAPDGREVTAAGWVRTKRESKNFSFVELNDGSCLRNLQIVVDQALPDYAALLPRVTTGASLRVTGRLVASPGEGQSVELQAREIMLCGSADPDRYPLQKKRHSLEFLREQAFLRPRSNTLGAVTRVRSALSLAIHRFFQERDFLYIHTPIITTSDCEGAGEMFQVTTLPLERLAGSGAPPDYQEDFFGKKTYLTVSGQLAGEAYACALGNIYTFGPTFRAEHSSTTRHLAEFWMVEPEMAFCDLHGDMDVAEEFLKYIFRYVLEHCGEDLAFFNRWIDPAVLPTLEQVVQEQFARISYGEAVAELQRSGARFEFPVRWGADLQSEHEKYLTERIFRKPVMVTDYPKGNKAFYMKVNPDGETVRALDVLVPRLGEIIGGSEREDDLDRLEGRIREAGLNPEAYTGYLDLRRYGSVPHAGFGLGLERTVQFVTGMQNIRDVIPFPRTYRSAEY